MFTQLAFKRLVAMLCGVAAMLVISGPAAAEKRVALVIGNSAYQHTASLKNPSNDAIDIAAKLRALGFDVIDGTDLSKEAMETRIRAFADKLQGSDVGLFFYAGHGLAADGRNFLAPVDAKLQSETDLDFEAVELSLVLKQMERNSRVSLVFLDACRDNPLALNLAATSRSLQVTRGLARVDRAVGMMIAFSTQPGNVALDGAGRNSPFTNALLQHIDAEGASINDMMIEVRNDVLKETNGKQVPWENSSLTGQFFFKPAEEKVADASSGSASEIAELRKEIGRIQSDQGALLASQQEQLKLLREKLANETSKAEAEKSKPANGEQGLATSRVIVVEPAKPADKPTEAAAASPADDKAADDKSPEETKVATAGSDDKTPTPEPSKSEVATLPEGITRDELTTDIVTRLSELQCYQGPITANWDDKPQDALQRFNDLAKLELPLEEPSPETLAALKDWKGAHCVIEAAVPKGKPPVAHVTPKAPKPKYKAKVPYKKPYRNKSVSSPPPSHHGDVGDEQRELQRAFPSTNWPGSR
ncbi:MAG TPA: caspase domain-containing protein [Methyloceanibacter sp.]